MSSFDLSFLLSFLKRWRLSLGIAAVLTVGAAAAQGAATAGRSASNVDAITLDSSGNYTSEVQACKEGRTGQNQATCLREARNAQAARKHGGLTVANADFQANALARCAALQGDDRAACQARMTGHGEVTGSVAGGGVLREVEIVVPPPGATQFTVQPQTSSPVMVAPQTSQQRAAGEPVVVVPVPMPAQ